MRLRTRYALLFSLILILVAAGSLVSAVNAQEALREAYTTNAVSHARGTMLFIADELSDRVQDVHGEAATPLMRDAVRTSNAAFAGFPGRAELIAERDRVWKSGNQSAFISERLNSGNASALIHWTELDTGNPLFREAILTNRYGTIVAATGRTSDYLQADETWWQEAWRNGAFINPEYDQSTGRYGFFIAVPVLDANGTKIGVLGVLYPLNELHSIFQNLQDVLTLPFEAKLVSDDDRLLHGFQDDPRYQPLATVADEEWFQPATEGQGSFTRPTPTGERFYAYATSPPDTTATAGWTLVLSFPQRILFQPVNRIMEVLLLTGMVLFLIITVAGYWLYRDVQRPVTRLTSLLTRLSRGNLWVDIPDALLQRNDEIGELARSFNRMLTSLKLAARKNLEAER